MKGHRTALITGIHGQDGHYLAHFLSRKGYRVVGVGRGSHPPELSGLEYRQAELTDLTQVIRLVADVRPSEVFNLAAQSLVPVSWEQPVETSRANTLPLISLLEAIRQIDPEIRYFQASSAQMFGSGDGCPCDENTPFSPTSPYAVSKLFAHLLTVNYRESYDLFAVSGILFNHESPLRSTRFVSRKITATVAAIVRGETSHLRLGDMTAVRDWGFAGDFVRGMWLSLQANEASDYVFGTGQAHTVEDFVRLAFEAVGLDWHLCVKQDPDLERPNEPDVLVADAGKARDCLGWVPEVSFRGLIEMMVQADLTGEYRLT